MKNQAPFDPAAALAALEACVSPQRLAPYRTAPGEPPEAVLSRYFWNVALCEALYPALHHAEVALRNALFRAISDWHGSDAWVSGGPAPFLEAQERSAVAGLLAARQRSRQPADPPHMVSALHLGFWTGLLDVRYERGQILWPRLLKTTFPGMPRRLRTRANALGRFDAVRRLRNRVFHHEPVWNIPDLPQKHAATLEAIGWISPALRDLAAVIDRFAEVYAAGPSATLAWSFGEVPANRVRNRS